MKQYSQVGDIVLAVDNNHLYEAKILRADFVGSWKYFIHYQSWGRKFDCWVDEQLIAKKEDTAKQARIVQGSLDAALAKTLTKKAKKAAAETKETGAESGVEIKTETISTRSVQAAPVKEEEDQTSSIGKRKVVVETAEQERIRKNKRLLHQMDLVDDDDESFVAKLPIPYPLKKHLIDEHTLIASSDAPARLLDLPKAKEQTVGCIIKEFLNQKIKVLEKDKVQIHAYQALMDGLVVHSDKALPSILLYRQERAQYDALVEAHPTKAPSQLYGAEHLLRLFVRMPKLLSNVCLPPSEINQILAKLTEVI
eukprot:gene28110-31754_t